MKRWEGKEEKRGKGEERERLHIWGKEDNQLNKIPVEMKGMSSRAPWIGSL